jgi:uncharacterized membrane protein
MLTATISVLDVWRAWIIIQGGITLALLLLSCGRVVAMPKRRLGQLEHRSLILLLISYAFVLTAMIGEIHNRITIDAPFKPSSIILFFGLCFADASLYVFMRGGYGIQ